MAIRFSTSFPRLFQIHKLADATSCLNYSNLLTQLVSHQNETGFIHGPTGEYTLISDENGYIDYFSNFILKQEAQGKRLQEEDNEKRQKEVEKQLRLKRNLEKLENNLF